MTSWYYYHHYYYFWLLNIGSESRIHHSWSCDAKSPIYLMTLMILLQIIRARGTGNHSPPFCYYGQEDGLREGTELPKIIGG